MSFREMKSKEERERETMPHPIWRGVGLFMIVVVPILSFVISQELVNGKNEFWEATIPEFILPIEMRGTVSIPIFGEVENFLGILALTVIIVIAIFALFSVVNAVVYRTTREKNLRVFESQPERYKRKKKLKKAKDR